MKKMSIFTALVVIFMGSALHAQNNKPFELKIDENGKASMEKELEKKLADIRRCEIVQLETGQLREVEVDGAFLGFQGGASMAFADMKPLPEGTTFGSLLSPSFGIAGGLEGMSLWKARNRYNGELHAVRIWSIEGQITASIRQYEPQSATPEGKYWSYSAMVYPKIAVAESRWVSHRLNIVGAVGYLYARDNSEIVEVETPTTIDTYYAYYTGSGVVWGGGLEYSYRFPMATSRIGLKVTAENIPVVHLNETERVWTLKASVFWTFGIARLRH
ncbi:MAG: hypothetical protein IJS26_05830 [Alphaproteobacteria bacterium]|nr:hypothetical protein [Alphaproteobacteria bacterium]